MGDRCYLHIDARPKDARILAKALGIDEPNYKGEKPTQKVGDNGLVEIEIEEANYGCYEELNGAGKIGVAFIGWHTAGGEYSAQAFASDESSECPEFVDSGHDGGYVVAVGEDGIPLPVALQNMADFVECRTRVEKLHIAARPIVMVCDVCGSSDVEVLTPTWSKVNDEDAECDGNDGAAQQDSYCCDCGKTGIDLLVEEDYRGALHDLKSVGCMLNVRSGVTHPTRAKGGADLTIRVALEEVEEDDWFAALSVLDRASIDSVGALIGFVIPEPQS